MTVSSSPHNPSNSVIVRLRLFNEVGVLNRVTQKISDLGGNIGAIDIVRPEPDALIRDITIFTHNPEHGEILVEKSLEIECDLEDVYNNGEKFLLSSKDGWIWEFENEHITVARKLRGTIQDAIFDGDDWRIISWRDDLMLRGESIRRADLGVQLIQKDEGWMVLDNQGNFSRHMSESE